MDSYRAEKQAAQRLSLEDEDAEIEPVPAGGGGTGRPEPELEPLSLIIAAFNDTYGTDFTDSDKVAELIRTLPNQVVNDTAYRNARQNSDPQNARIEHDAGTTPVDHVHGQNQHRTVQGLHREPRLPSMAQ